MRFPIPMTLIAALALLAGCVVSPPAAIPVTSPGHDVQRLAGDWQGDFSSTETGRHGIISFHLDAGADSAQGQVLMYLRQPSEPIWKGVGPTPGANPPEQTQWLSIRFVDVEGGSVSGAIEPYTDPVCDCSVVTTFLGKM